MPVLSVAGENVALWPLPVLTGLTWRSNMRNGVAWHGAKNISEKGVAVVSCNVTRKNSLTL